MAIDFWKLSGQPTSYSPLDSYVGLSISHQGTFVITFKAKSNSKTMLLVSGNADIYFELTPEWKEYTCEMDVHNYIGIADDAGYYDASIKDLKVIEKPLDKLTNNRLDGFGTVGNNIWWWDSYEALPPILEEDGQYLLPGTYEIEYEARSDSEYGSFFFWTVQTGRDTIPTIYQSLTFEWQKYFHRLTVPEVADYYVSDGDETDASSVRNITVRKLDTKWTLHENARMIDSQSLNSGSGQNVSEIVYNLNPGTYTLSCVSNGGTLYARDITTSDNSANNLAVVDYTAQPKQFTLATPRKVAIRHYGGSVEKPMLNLGSVPLPYEPKYGERFRTNATPNVKVPKKNMWDGTFDVGFLTVSTNDIFLPTQGQRTTKWIACKPNTTYILSGGDRRTWQFRDGVGNRISPVDAQTAISPSNATHMRVYYSTNGSHTQVQIEEGSTPTPYELYKEVLPQAKRLLPVKRVFEAKR
jgi:hypothetical protein